MGDREGEKKSTPRNHHLLFAVGIYAICRLIDASLCLLLKCKNRARISLVYQQYPALYSRCLNFQ